MAEAKKTKDDYNIDFDKIRELISDYEEIKKSGEIKHKNETETRDSFISPLFNALGWNTENRLKSSDSVSKEENIAGKRSDYSFRINGIPKFFLEAKSLKEENIHKNSEYVKQAINYAWMKSCSWAILCNFETIAVYNADWKDSNYGNNVLFEFHPGDFITNQNFKMLSKKSFEKNELDIYAKVQYKKQLKYRIDKQLLQDMIHFREVLSKDIVRNNQQKHLTQDDIDESVQRILDRLIFIRNAEDRGLEENQLQSNVRQWYAKGKGYLLKEISRIYNDFDNKYNSKLFAHHLCDALYIDNEALQEVIEGLNHSKDNSYRYDFSIIESDVLGNIYEQYLGNILKSTPKRAKLEESKTHRKEQGIYYTPSYIVDYIAKNTVGEYIKAHTPEEIKKVRILDPACGSGSFLIRAYKELENYWKNNSNFAQLTLDSEEFYSKKVEILKNNIFGVDLDPKAVEIAQLNLLMQISERKQRLPILQNNIKIGNSLIDDLSISDKAFKWDEEFSEIMIEGGFDIVIGNPPYEVLTKAIVKNEILNYLKNAYMSAEYNPNLFALFIEKSINILNERGQLGFIIQNSLFTNIYFKNARKIILDKTKINAIVDLRFLVFEGVIVDSSIILLQNEVQERARKSNITKVSLNITSSASINSPPISFDFEQSFFYNYQTDYRFSIYLEPRILKIIQKMDKVKERLGTYVSINRGIGLVNPEDRHKASLFRSEKSSQYDKKVFVGKDINLYSTKWSGKWAKIVESTIVGGTRNPKVHEAEEKIIFPRIRNLKYPQRILASYDDEKIWVLDNYNILRVDSDKVDIKFVLGLLNSKIINFYFRNMFIDVNIKTNFIEKLPLAIPKDQNRVVERVDRMLSLMNSLNELNGKVVDKTVSIKNDIKQVDRELNDLMYDLYNLTKDEKKIVEDTFK